MFKRIREFFLRKYRTWYEDRINLQYGINQFLANVAFIQLTHEEFLILNPPSAYCGDIHLTTEGMRPVLTYSVWLEGMEYPKEHRHLPTAKVIVERDKFQVWNQETSEWDYVTIKDERVRHLKDLFLAFAFYPPLRAEWKKKK